MAEIELKGVKEIIDKLQQIGANVGKLENQALKNAAEPVLQDAKANVPVDTGKLQEHLDIGAVKKKDGIKYIDIGVTKNDYKKMFYGKFVEFGTTQHAARPFLGPAIEKNKTVVENIIAQTLKEGIK